MIVESAQMLSTAHRMIDGTLTYGLSKSGKRVSKQWIHPNPELNSILYKAVHMSHPCTVWTMKSSANYIWHYRHYIALCEEYTHRYGKTHSTDRLLSSYLQQIPKHIKYGELTQFSLAMNTNPECMYSNDPVRSYREFYQTKQERFKMEWTNRPIPDWFKRRDNNV